MLIAKIIENNTMHSMQELYLFLCLFSYSTQVILACLTASTVSVHSSTNLSTNFFLYNFHNLNTHQHHMIYHTHIHNY